jgi:hypothetical protein
MKKLFLIVLIFVLTMCVSPKSFLVCYKAYSPSDKNNSIKELYDNLKNCGLDSIPLNKWYTIKANSKDLYIIQRTLIKSINEKTQYKFTYTEFKNPSYVTYQIQIYCLTNDKILLKKYKK